VREAAEKRAKARGGASNGFAALLNLESDADSDDEVDVPAAPPPTTTSAPPAAQESTLAAQEPTASTLAAQEPTAPMSKKARQKARKKAK
jgi:hypothetical protein